jgi:hypothetical protein
MNPEQQPTEETAPTNQWNYTSGELVGNGEQTQPNQNATSQSDSSEPLLSWSASEFIEHDKTITWYAGLAGITVLIAIIVFIFTRQIVSIILVALMAVVFGVYGSAKPRILSYAVTTQGLVVGDKMHPFSTVKSFSVIQEEGMPYIQVLFQKRLSIPITIYAAPEEIDVIAETIGQYVPYDQKKRDVADKLSSKIRF